MGSVYLLLYGLAGLCLGLAPAGGSSAPLLLTQFIDERDPVEAIAASSVPIMPHRFPSHAGFLTINKTSSSNLFFWYFKAEEEWEGDSGLLVWLGGGGGGGTLGGPWSLLDGGGGPLAVGPGGRAGPRADGARWTQAVSLLAFDPTLGAGYSSSASSSPWALPASQEDVAADLLASLRQFKTLFPLIASRPIYVGGEWIGAKSAVALAMALKEESEFNLAGVVLGSVYLGPEQLDGYSDFFYQTGLVDLKGKGRVKAAEAKVMERLRDEGLLGCGEAVRDLWKRLEEESGFDGLDNLLNETEAPSSLGPLLTFFNSQETREALHVGSTPFNHNDTNLIEDRLKFDLGRSARGWLEDLLDGGVRVLVFNGQLDLSSPPPLTSSWLRGLDWAGVGEWASAPRAPWHARQGGELAGYSKAARGLTHLVVRNAGHRVPNDQPLWALDMITRFVSNKPF